jgi:hypothetical protein
MWEKGLYCRYGVKSSALAIGIRHQSGAGACRLTVGLGGCLFCSSFLGRNEHQVNFELPVNLGGMPWRGFSCRSSMTWCKISSFLSAPRERSVRESYGCLLWWLLDVASGLGVHQANASQPAHRQATALLLCMGSATARSSFGRPINGTNGPRPCSTFFFLWPSRVTCSLHSRCGHRIWSFPRLTTIIFLDLLPHRHRFPNLSGHPR